jgi:uncharacterized membrane protein YphA (DoxX/SURF4 family)
MNPTNKFLKIAGLVLHVLIALFVMFAGFSKVAGMIPAEELAKLPDSLRNQLLLIGIGELIAGLLLLIPWTAPLGTLVMSGFWGGVISFHLLGDHDIATGIVMLSLTWIAAFLRGSVPLLAVKPAPASQAA